MRTRSLRLSILTGLTALILTAAPVLAALTTVSGYAYGEYVNVTPVGLVNVQSGPLPTAGPLDPNTGGNFTNSAASVCVGAGAPITCPVLSTGALDVATSATGPAGAFTAVNSTASVLTVNALAGVVTASAVSSQCSVDSNGQPTGSSTINTLAIQGIAYTDTAPGPNTTINLVVDGVIVGRVVLNEQSYDAATNQLTVNAIHIYLLPGGALGEGEIIIAHVECDASPLVGPVPVVPESPLTILLPLMAIAVVGGALLLMSRRNTSFLQH